MKNLFSLFFLIGLVATINAQSDGKPDKGTGLHYFTDSLDMVGFTPAIYDSEIGKRLDTEDYWNYNRATGVWTPIVDFSGLNIHDPATVSSTSNPALTINPSTQIANLDLDASGSFDNTNSNITSTSITDAINELAGNQHPAATVTGTTNPALTIDPTTQLANLDLDVGGSYDNSTSGLTNNSVQGAIDELAAQPDDNGVFSIGNTGGTWEAGTVLYDKPITIANTAQNVPFKIAGGGVILTTMPSGTNIEVEAKTQLRLSSEDGKYLLGSPNPSSMPPTDNATNFLLGVDNSTFPANLKLVDKSTIGGSGTPADADWHIAGGSTAPTNITDDIFTQGFVGIGVTSPQTELDLNGTLHFNSGVNNEIETDHRELNISVQGDELFSVGKQSSGSRDMIFRGDPTQTINTFLLSNARMQFLGTSDRSISWGGSSGAIDSRIFSTVPGDLYATTTGEFHLQATNGYFLDTPIPIGSLASDKVLVRSATGEIKQVTMNTNTNSSDVVRVSINYADIGENYNGGAQGFLGSENFIVPPELVGYELTNFYLHMGNNVGSGSINMKIRYIKDGDPITNNTVASYFGTVAMNRTYTGNVTVNQVNDLWDRYFIDVSSGSGQGLSVTLEFTKP